MLATKEQERKALERIRKIVADLGENSYIGTAFDGCFEIAEENIDNDFACSMKQRAESAQKEMEYFKTIAERLHDEKEQLETRVRQLEHKEITAELEIKIHNVCVSRYNALSEEKAELETEILALVAQADSPEFKEAAKRYTDVKSELADITQLMRTIEKMVAGQP